MLSDFSRWSINAPLMSPWLFYCIGARLKSILNTLDAWGGFHARVALMKYRVYQTFTYLARTEIARA